MDSVSAAILYHPTLANVLPLGVKAVNPPSSSPARDSSVPDGVQLDSIQVGIIDSGSNATLAEKGTDLSFSSN